MKRPPDVYFVSYEAATPDEPGPGWFFASPCGEYDDFRPSGPYPTKRAALEARDRDPE